MQKIAVIGLGLNGLACAIAACKAGFDVEIFESGNLEDFKKDKRTSVLTYETIRFFQELEVFAKLESKLAEIAHIYTFEEGNEPVLSFDKGIVSENPFGYVVHNSALKEVLLKEISRLKIKIIKNAVKEIETIEGNARITLENEEILEFNLILNCGGKSVFSEERIVLPYKQTAFVFNISHSGEHKNIAIESFFPNGIVAVLPLHSPFNSAVILSLNEPVAEFFKTLKKAEFLPQLKGLLKRIRHTGEVLEVISDVKTYDLSLSFTKFQAKGRMLLMGDAFNAIHPVAGQAFNMSVKDVKNLYHHLLFVKKLGLDAGSETLLETLTRKNLKHHLEMNTFTHVLVKSFAGNNPLLKFGRGFALRAIEETPFIKNFLMKKASGV